MNTTSTSTRPNQKPSMRWSIFVFQHIECILLHKPWNTVLPDHSISLPIIQPFQIAFKQIQWSIIFLIYQIFIIVFQLDPYFVTFIILTHLQPTILHPIINWFPIPHFLSIKTLWWNILYYHWSHLSFIFLLELIYVSDLLII